MSNLNVSNLNVLSLYNFWHLQIKGISSYYIYIYIYIYNKKELNVIKKEASM